MQDVTESLAKALREVLPMAETELAHLYELGESDSTYESQARVGMERITRAQWVLSMHECLQNAPNSMPMTGCPD